MNFRFQLFLLLLVWIFASCSKWEEPPVINQLNVVNAYPDAANLHIRVNNDIDTTLSFGSATGYQQLRAGKSTLQVSIGNIPTTIGNLFLAENRVYSLYIFKRKIEGDSVIIRIDTLPAPEVGRAKIRFANLTPVAEALDLRLRVISPTNDTLILPSRTSPNYTPFTTIDAAQGYNLSLLRGNEIVATLPADNLASERTYTFIAVGYATPPPGNSKSLTLQVIENRLAQ